MLVYKDYIKPALPACDQLLCLVAFESEQKTQQAWFKPLDVCLFTALKKTKQKHAVALEPSLESNVTRLSSNISLKKTKKKMKKQ